MANSNVLFIEDVKHSQKEDRFIAIGKNLEEKVLFTAFTWRRNKVRVISVRMANQKERKQYEKT